MSEQSDDRMQLSVGLPRDLVAAIDAAADERMIGRRLFIEKLLAEGMEALIPVGELRLVRQPDE